ncbi:MAG: DUF4238 domain-containing protein [Patescibacteria group bacterium]|nr:DUF4238 domain-containing protein [Patescibacteria group bacterium]
MSEGNNETIDHEEIKIFQKFIHFSQLLDPKIETISLSESKYIAKIYFKESRKLCFSYEYEGREEKKIWIYRNIKIEEENDTLMRKLYLLELFFTIPLRFDIRTIKIQNFPINKNDMMEYLDEYNKSYQKRLVPQKEIFSSDNKSLQSGVYQITIVRKNHYIPQGYLRKFECESKPGYIYNFKLIEAKFEESSGVDPVKIENILHIKHFYSLGMELILKNIEDAFYTIRNKIISDNSLKRIVYEEKISIVRYIFAQYLRTPLERNRFVNQARIMLESLYSNRVNQKINKDEIYIEFNDLYIRLMLEGGIYQFLFPSPKETRQVELINFYLKNKWKLISAGNMKFNTSDNPIIMHNDCYEPIIDQDYIDTLKTPNSKIFGTKRPHGLMEPGIQLYFPITPKLCILIYNPQFGQRLLKPVEINEQGLIQCYQNILSSNNKIRNFLKRKLNQKRKKREKFVELHLNVKIEEF